MAKSILILKSQVRLPQARISSSISHRIPIAASLMLSPVLHTIPPITHQSSRSVGAPLKSTGQPRQCKRWTRLSRQPLHWESRSAVPQAIMARDTVRSEEHTSELQSPDHLVCRLLLEKKKQSKNKT